MQSLILSFFVYRLLRCSNPQSDAKASPQRQALCSPLRYRKHSQDVFFTSTMLKTKKNGTRVAVSSATTDGKFVKVDVVLMLECLNVLMLETNLRDGGLFDCSREILIFNFNFKFPFQFSILSVSLQIVSIAFLLL